MAGASNGRSRGCNIATTPLIPIPYQAFAQVWHRRADLKMVALAVLLSAERHAVQMLLAMRGNGVVPTPPANLQIHVLKD